jgi:hypothetical protein
MKLKITALLLAAALCATLSGPALALDEPPTSGYCGVSTENNGENVSWNYDMATNVLTISGTGAMGNLNGGAPWHVYQDTMVAAVIEDGVTSISSGALIVSTLDSYRYLTSVSIPASVTEIADSSLGGLVALESYTLDAENQNYKAVDGVIFSADGTELVAFPSGRGGAYSIPEGTVSVAHWGALHFNDQLTSLHIPASLIDYSEFWLSSIERYSVDAANPSYSSSEDGVLFSKDGTSLIAYPSAKPSRTYVIPNTVTNIGASAFTSANTLRIVYIPANVQTFDNRSFQYAYGLYHIVIEDGAGDLTEGTFYSISNLKTALFLDRDIVLGSDIFGIYSATNEKSTVTIYGYNGSTVQTYADANDHEFVGFDTYVPVSGLTLNANELALEVGGYNLLLTSDAVPPEATLNAVIWVSSDESIATVYDRGYVQGNAPGTATITAISAADPSVTATCTVTVTSGGSQNPPVGGGGGGGNSSPSPSPTPPGALIDADKPLTVAAGNNVTVTLDAETLSTLSDDAKSDSRVEITADIIENEALSDWAAELTKDALVIDLTAKVDGKQVSDFGKGIAEVRIPYPVSDDVAPSRIVAFLLTDGGMLVPVVGSYDAEAGAMVLRLRHFSKYLIKISDLEYEVSGGWHDESLDYAAHRRLLDRFIADGNIDAGQNVTRGDFIAAYLKANGIEPLDKFTVPQFDDVSGINADYIRTARELGVVNGIGGNKFSPDAYANREQFFQIMYNMLQAGISKTPDTDTGKSSDDFADSNKLPDWAKTATDALVSCGIIVGDGGKLQIGENFTVGTMSAVLMRTI